jgi:hypothetical protein
VVCEGESTLDCDGAACADAASGAEVVCGSNTACGAWDDSTGAAGVEADRGPDEAEASC